MKTLLLTALLAAPCLAQTTPLQDADALAVLAKTTADSLRADSLATAINVGFQADSTMVADEVAVVTHIGYGWTVSWDYPAVDLSGLVGIEKTYSIKTIVSDHKGIQDGDQVRFRRDRGPAIMATLKALLE